MAWAQSFGNNRKTSVTCWSQDTDFGDWKLTGPEKWSLSVKNWSLYIYSQVKGLLTVDKVIVIEVSSSRSLHACGLEHLEDSNNKGEEVLIS